MTIKYRQNFHEKLPVSQLVKKYSAVLNSKYPIALIKRASIVLSVNTNLIQNFSHYKLDWSVYTCLTQLYGGIYMYNLLHKEQLHVSALFIGHLQVDK